MVASKLFTEEDRSAVSAAVAEAEKRTSGEIVPVVATMSDRYDRAEDVFGLCVAGATVAAAWLLLQEAVPARGEWRSGWEPALGLLPVLAIFLGAFVVGVLVADKVDFLRRLFAGRWVMRPRVEAAAAEAFSRFHVRRTKAATGIVIYVSLFERMVTVEADRAIAEKVGASEWKAICDGLVRAMREGRHREGLVEAIRKCGDLLATHFPVQPGDVDEVANELRVID